MNIITRFLEKDDLEIISKIHVDVWNETYRGIISDEELDKRTYSLSKKKWEESFSNKKKEVFTIVAESGGELAGFAIGSTKPRDQLGIDSELVAMNVLRKFHGNGIGKKLFYGISKRLSELNSQKMYLWVVEENKNAVGFYEHLKGTKLPNKKEACGVAEISYYWDLL